MKNVKTMYRKLTMMVVLGVLLAVMSCNNLLTPPKGNSTDRDSGSGNVSEDGKVLITLKLFTGSARMVMPDIEQLDWHITAEQGTDSIPATGTYPTYTLELPTTGPWTFTVKGTKENKELFTGTVTENVSNSTTSISIPLSPGSGMIDSGATGKLNLTIKPENVLTMTLRYRVDGGGWYTCTPMSELGPDQEMYWTPYSIKESNLSVGQHTLDLYFGGGSKFYFCTVAVNIWPGMTSDRWIKTNGEEYIDDNGEFVITEEMVNEFVKTMGSVVFVDASVNTDEPATGSIFAPVNSVSTAVDILRKANPGGKCNGTIMVSGETTIDREIEVLSGETLTVKGTGTGDSIKNTSGRVFNITSGGSLTLGENITLTGTNATGNGGAVYVAGGTFTMEDGSKIIGSRAQNGGGVYIASGTFNLTGTAILQDNMATTHGGGVHIFSGGTFTMNGGTIDGTAQNTAEYGGGVFVSGGTFSMNDGTITGNKVTQSGGGVYVNNGTFTMKGGTIGGTTANTATQNGGGVFVQAGTFNMNGSAVIQGNEATGGSSPACGGGVYINGGTFTMNGTAIIQDNKATGTNGHACGGGVYVNSTGKFDMGDTATIQGNNASTTDTNSAAGGGGVYVNGGTFTMTGTAKIQGNTTTSTDSVKTPSGGGGVFVIAGGTFTMSGGSIGGTEANSANEADLGGGVYVGVNADTGEKGSFTMGGGTIKGNTATQNGGGVYVNGGTFTMNGGGITGNESDGNGGGVYLDDTNAKVTLNNTSSISGNVVAGEGGGVYVGNGTFTLSGSPNISRNGLDGLNNVYLTSRKTISIGAEGLTSGTIGVTAEAITTGGIVQITNENVPGADGIFTSDVKGYAIVESSGAVYLSDAETKYVGTDGTETFGAFETTRSAVNRSADGGTITLLKDIDGSNAVFKDAFSQPRPITFTGGTETKPIILDLNGKTINRGLSAATNNGSVIKIEGGTLTIKDSSATNLDGTGGKGMITGGNSSGGGGGIHITDKSGGGIHGSLILESGSIRGNTADMSLGGGIYIDSDCAFTMKGGSIDGNTVKNSDGGGVFVYGTFTMENGSITNNRSEQGNGGGVNIGTNGNFTMTDGTIKNNTAGGSNGGGVYIANDCAFTMSGGTISGNTATNTGGGVFVSSSTGSFEIGTSSTVSSPVVSGNTKTNSSPNNVYLYDNTLLHIAGKLNKTEESGNIGITMSIPGEEFEFTSGWSDSTVPTFFFSDDRERNVALSGSELSLNLVRVDGGSCILNGQNVTLSSFWISPYEVTQEEFVSVMTGNKNGIASNPSYFPDNPAAGEVQERRPVERVRWYDAIVYCNLLSIKEGLTPCYTINGSTAPADWRERPDSDVHDNYNVWNSVTCNFDADGYRLPTEAEWEYAARGGNPKDSSWNNTYSGSDTLEDVAWYSNNSDSKTHEVGKKQANALGLYDMSGNLKEWCWNRKSEDNDSRVMRGGYYSSGEDGCQVTAFDSNFPISQGPDQGFRVVRSIR